MKKFYLIAAISFLKLSGASAQTVTSTVVNFRELAAWEAQHPEALQQCRTCPKKEIDGGWKGISNPNMPIPAGAKVTTNDGNTNTPTPNGPNGPNNPLSPSLPPAQSWLGYIDPGNTIPPDTHGAVGLNHVVTTTNDFVKIHNKSGGGTVSQVSVSTFTGIASTCDPYMAWDPATQRFYFSSIECSSSNGNRMILMVSQTSDPTGTWRKITWVPSSTDGSLFLDHPYLGFDSRWIVVSGNKFPSLVTFTGPMLFLFDKTAVNAGSAIVFGTNAQTIERSSADGIAPLPVTVYEPPFSAVGNPIANTFYILQSWNNTSIRLTTVTGNIPSAVWNTTTGVFPSSAANPWNSGDLGNFAQQLGETRRLAANDPRISCGVMMNGKIWAAHHIGLPASTSDRVAVQWWQLDAANTGVLGNVLQRGRIGGAIASEYKWFPSIAVNKFEDVLIGYTSSTSTTRVGAAYSTRQLNTTPNTTDDELIYKAGLDVYWKDFNSGRARWGDYSHSALDPSDNSLWTIEEAADLKQGGTGDNNSRYAVWWAQVLFPSSQQQRDASLASINTPVAGSILCNFPVTPQVTIKNLGTDSLKSVQIVWQLDGVTQLPSPTTWNTPPGLASLQTTTVNLAPNLTSALAAGNHTMKAWTQLPNGLADQRLNNDTVSIVFSVLPTLPLNALQDFEPAGAPMPPTGGWEIFNPDGARTWAKRTGVTGPTGASTSCMWLDAANYAATGQIDRFITPKIDLTGIDTIKMSWDLAKTYWPGFTTDTMRVMYSDDCGITWKKTSYERGGVNFITAPPQAGDFVPSSASQWIKESLAIPTCGFNGSTIRFAFEFRNGFGNNIFIDNIAITKVNTVNPNAAAINILQPSATLCGTTFTPVVTIGNFGTAPLTAVNINYQVDNGTIGTFNWTGSLPRCSTAVVTLNSLTSTAGNHILTVFTSNPNGTADLFPANDTTRKPFSISPQIAMPLVEGFESATFPPTNWSVQNPGGSVTWARSTASAATGGGSMWMNAPTNANASDVDRFFSPVMVNSTSYDSVYIEWDHAYMPGIRYPGSTNLPLDTLEMMVTTDCGATFKTVWKKWGEDLQSILDPNLAYNPSFTPTANEWMHDKVFLTPYVGSSNFQVYIVAKTNKQNNIWIDNINIYSKTVPVKVKNNGYAIYPTPFTSSFRIHHWIAPADLQAVQVFNAAGQLVWDKRYNGNANTEIFVDTRTWAGGVYTLKMTYDTKVTVDRIVKQ